MAWRGLYSGVGITYPEWTSLPGGETEAGEAEGMLRLHNWPTDQPVLPLLGCQAGSCVLRTRGKSEVMPTHSLS